MKQINKYKILPFLLFLFAASTLKAQQEPQYTQYMYNMSVVNPAYAGSKDALSLGALARQQWVGVSGAPGTFTAFIHGPVGRNVGLGLSVISDQIGPVKETNAYADFSYTIRTSEESKLAFGLKAGFTFQNIGLLSLTQVSPNDPLFNENVDETYPNIGAGAFYYTDDLYIGLSIPNILKSKHFEKNNGIITNASEEMHTFFTAGMVFDLSENVKFKPSMLTKFAFHTPVSVDVSANFLFMDRFELGASYRWDDSVSGLINVLVTDTLRVGYAYDHTVSNLGLFNSGSHEVFMLFDFSFSRSNVRSPRFF